MRFILQEENLVFTAKKQILYFYTSWMPCHKKMIIMIGKMEEKYKDINFFAIDADYFKGLCKRFNVKSVPMVLILDQGTEKKRINGLVTTSVFTNIFADICNSEMENLMSKKKTSKDPTLAQQAQNLQQNLDQKNADSMVGTVAGEIWTEIKDRPIEMFALPAQAVNMHCHPIAIEPSKLYLLTNSSAVLPSLENAIGKNYVVDLVDKFVVVSRALLSITKR